MYLFTPCHALGLSCTLVHFCTLSLYNYNHYCIIIEKRPPLLMRRHNVRACADTGYERVRAFEIQLYTCRGGGTSTASTAVAVPLLWRMRLRRFFFFFFFFFLVEKIYILTVQNIAEQHVIRECKIMKVKVRATKFSDIVKYTERGRHIGGRGVIQVFKNLERCWFRR